MNMGLEFVIKDVPHPGEFIREELDARGWSQRDLAYILGVAEQSITMIVSGKRGISPEMAKALGKAFGVSAEYFANLQQAYEMSNARAPDPSIERRALLQAVYPVREMIKRGWLQDTDIGLIEAQVARFFDVANLNEVPCIAHAAKKSDYSETTPLQIAWLHRVKHLAAEQVTLSFRPQALEKLLSQLPNFMTDPEEVRHVPRMLAECGIRFVLVETLPKANIDGVCFWIDDDSPVIGMTARHDRIDNFWFVLRHELEHVRAGDGRGELSVELVDVDLELQGSSHLPEAEQKANEAAASCCVPTDELERFYVRKYPYIKEKDVVGFAGRIGRHPGIVVGQLQHKMGRYDWLARYKVKVRHFLLPNAVHDGWGFAAPVSL
jgi:HTH-type transcriptional regulator/antitoxin HigA